jgi:hypothetical protein
MFRYDNILISEIDSSIATVAGATCYIIFDVSKVPVTSFGLYNDTHGVEYVISQLGEVHSYRRVPLDQPTACTHWIFDYVDSGTTKDKNIAYELKLFEYVQRGSFQTVFDYLKMILEEL